MSDILIDAIPFVIYSMLLVKAGKVWKRLIATLPKTELRGRRGCQIHVERRKTNLLMAILMLLTLCTLVFMASNIYTLIALEKTLLSIKVFQMFVVGNCVFYWLVLDLVVKDVTTE